jgi:flagellar basal body-associated protein FliL
MKRSSWIVIGIVAVLVVAGSVGGYFYPKGNQTDSPQKHQYLQMAADFDVKAGAAASSAEEARKRGVLNVPTAELFLASAR